MRYELADYEWTAIEPMLPNKPRGVPRVNDRRVLNGIFWVLRSGAAWRDLPDGFGPYTTCYNRNEDAQTSGVEKRREVAGNAVDDAGEPDCIVPSTHLSFDYQFIANPAYNTDRGPVNLFSGRIHWQF
jgi:transposase